MGFEPMRMLVSRFALSIAVRAFARTHEILLLLYLRNKVIRRRERKLAQ